MDDLATILALTIPLAPLVGIGLIIGGLIVRPDSSGPVKVSLAVASLGLSAAFILLFLSFTDRATPSASIDLGSWGLVHSSPVFEISFRFRLDLFALLFLVTHSLLSMTVCSVSLLQETSHEEQRALQLRVFFLWSTTSFFVLCDHLMLLVFFAQVSGFALASVLLTQAEDRHQTAAARNVLLLTRLGDVFLLVASFFYWAHLSTFLMFAMMGSEAQLALIFENKTSVLDSISVCLILGVLIRSALLPAFGWLKTLAQVSYFRLTVIHGLFLPMGIALLLRVSPLLGASDLNQKLLIVIGLATAGMAAFISLMQSNWKVSLSFLTVAGFGWCAMGIGIGISSAVHSALALLILLSTLIPLLDLIIGSVWEASTDELGSTASLRKRWPFGYLLGLVSVTVLTTGWVGLQGIIGPVLQNPTAVPLPLFSLRALLWVSLFLFTLALFRIYFRVFHSETAEETPSVVDANATPATLPHPALLLGLFLVGFGLSLLSITGTEALQIETTVLSFSLSAVLSAVGLSVLFFIVNPTWAATTAVRMSTLHRLGQQRFYLDTAFTLLLVFPIRAMATLLRFLDWFLIDTLLIGLSGRLPRLLGKISEPMPRGEPRFYVLSLMVSISVLLTLLTWFRG